MGGGQSHPGQTPHKEPARDDSRGRRASGRRDRRCEVWGVLNVTPDSFHDGGRYYGDPERALAQARRMVEEGADVIDVGGESSRPPGKTYGEGAALVPVEEELARVVPIIERIAAELEVGISVDTVKPEVARAAIAAGARIVNDVSCGADPTLFEVAADSNVPVVLMHTRDRGRVDERTTAYADVVRDVLAELEAAVERAVARGVPRGSIWIDPGLGFAKTADQSNILLGNLDAFVATGYPVLVGASRKSFIARTVSAAGRPEPRPEERLGGSLAAVTAAVLAGAAAVRVHDVYESVQAARVAEALRARARGAR